MSLARQFLREFRPLFRMLEEPLGRSHPAFFPPMQRFSPLGVLNDPFFNSSDMLQPAIDISEEGNQYIVEAELPGVKKENLEVKIGDNGQSLTIQGRTFTQSPQPPQAAEAQAGAAQTPEAGEGLEKGAMVKSKTGPVQISSERTFVASSAFSRTVWLPCPVDGNNVSAQLSDGVLTLKLSKAEDRGSVKVNVD